VEGFEEEVAAYCQVGHAVGVSSGTDALLAALMALGIGPGDEVITPAFTFFATAGCISRVGATPVFVDIDPGTFNIDPAAIAGAITERTKAIVPVHLFGQCADMVAILEIGQRHDLPVIEDAAQAIGADHPLGRAGSMGRLGCFSCYPGKNLGAFGDAGFLTTNDPDLAERLRILRNHGMKPRYYHHVVGGNFRLDAIQAVVLRIKLRHLDAWTQVRQDHATFYREALADLEGLTLPAPSEGRHVYNQFVVRLSDRAAAQSALREAGIGFAVYYPESLTRQPCFAGLEHATLEHTDEACEQVLALPMCPTLSPEQRARVTSILSAT
ncbi:MAG: DegT/DnrJ/EryC1/StrS family aminotransferase, partial [Planctomycetota bacterium]